MTLPTHNTTADAGVLSSEKWSWGLDDVDAIWAANAPDGGNVVCLPPPEQAKASFARWPARARLIAAAPELLEALEEQVSKCSDPTCEMCTRHEALIHLARTNK